MLKRILFAFYFVIFNLIAVHAQQTINTTQKKVAAIVATPADIAAYIKSRGITDTLGKTTDIVKIITNSKLRLLFNKTWDYEKALKVEEGRALRMMVSQEELNYLISSRNIKDTVGQIEDFKKVIRTAKGIFAYEQKPSYEEALTAAYDEYKLHHMVDKVLVVKSERKMYLQKQGKTVKTFPIALGPNPIGQKQYEGDGKTPEGTYTLDWTKYDTPVFYSFHISYPNQLDSARAKAKGLIPGSNIMVHGTSKGIKKKKDWTNGCIALSNQDMIEFRRIVFLNTAIEIRK